MRATLATGAGAVIPDKACLTSHYGRHRDGVRGVPVSLYVESTQHCCA